MVDKIMPTPPPSKHVLVLIPRVCEYVTLPNKKDFAHVVKARILIRAEYPGFSEWAQYNHKGLYKREAGVSKKRCDEAKALE